MAGQFSRGVIFDLDGVLIDSEGLYYRAYSEVLKPYGVTVSREEYEEHWIAQGTGPEYIVAKHNLPIAPDELRQLRSPIYLHLLETEVRLMPYVEETLAQLATRFALTVATNTNREHLDFVLRRMGIDRFFPVTVARQDYRRAKPQPDAFLTAARKLELPPERCVVIEDTYKGVMAAVNAGIRCVAVPNAYTLRNDFRQASLVLASLAELTPAVVAGLLK
ncbi:MAG: HAD family phosphatase [Deltaproteobacteria bacterium]|nr:HAD family phosphatase [Deltaproteobacteria bacterium]